ncbi:hypothetical protein GCM10009654_37520 [Streptomyces hebeiensis]|uniref:Lipoprotein n=1 Tax=Streptomyces hebeiensis TaxID=229486 RepID=A0ABN1UWV2_9ACTN
MAGQERTTAGTSGGVRRRTAVSGLAAALIAPAVSGCGRPAEPRAADPSRDAEARIRRTLARRAAAVLTRDERAYLDALAPGAQDLRAAERRAFRDLAEVPLGAWEYRITDVARSGARATVHADLRYRLTGHDSAPVATPRVLELGERAGRWYVTADRRAGGGAPQLWQQGTVRAVRGARALVLGVGQEDAALRALAAAADRAVPAVTDAWPDSWARKTVLLVPGSAAAMAALLGGPADGYRGIPAVTTGRAGRAGAAPADRIVVNPEAYGSLTGFGRQVVLTHETTHVATRTATSAATPTWLSEGFADWVAYRRTGRAASRIAPELQRAVRRGELPAGLPPDDDFAFDGDADRLARAYEGAWLACELIAERWGERRLTDFYRAVGGQERREGAVARAARDVLATSADDLTERWRAYARRRMG